MLKSWEEQAKGRIVDFGELFNLCSSSSDTVPRSEGPYATGSLDDL